jgi:(1->4)-alpha-D-glucan 1-alpha-D-glucosylmutase
MQERQDIDSELFVFLKDLLLLHIPGESESELAMRFQQLTASAMAKGLEDTAFYRVHRLVSLNEVGGNPALFGIPVEQFHRMCGQNLDKHPIGLVTTSTHDTKRSEDVRARLALLSEIPAQWAEAVRRWAAHNQRYRRDKVPDHNTEYLLYQTLVGAWPIDIDRVTAYMEKAIREAKVHTSWTQVDEQYEHMVRDFVQAIMHDSNFSDFLQRFVDPLVLPGRINSLAQTLVKLTVPGVPDIYQGTELWDLSLVDPDNRRPVNFRYRMQLLAEIDNLTPEEILRRADEGLPKLWVIRRALQLRRAHPELFGPRGSYVPLEAHGKKADHIIAFARGQRVITLAPRLVLGLNGNWEDTTIELLPGHWRNVLTDENTIEGACPLAAMLARFPVALLTRTNH